MALERSVLFKRGLVAAGALLLAIQLVPVDRSNPPVTGDIPTSTPVKAVLRRACYDCHSHETTWPWYAQIAPVKFLLARDVHEGRRHANFSAWDSYSPKRKAKILRDVAEQVAEGEMPMSIYVPLHPAARLSEQDKALIKDWATASAALAP